jgi:PAS domain S-box-containing protein
MAERSSWLRLRRVPFLEGMPRVPLVSALPRVSLLEGGFALVALALVVLPVTSFTVIRASNEAREQLNSEVSPLATALSRARVDALALGNEATRYALVTGITTRDAYDERRSALRGDVQALETLAEGTRFEGSAMELVTLAEALVASSDAGVQASLVNNGAVVQQELTRALPARMAAFGAGLAELDLVVRARIDELRTDQQDLAEQQQLVMLGSSLVGGAAMALLLLMFASRRRLLRAAEQERERFNGMVEATGFGVLQLDRHGRIEYVNPAAAEHLHYVTGELEGMRITALAARADPGGNGASAVPPFIPALRRHETHLGEETLVRGDGSLLSAEVGVYPTGRPGEEATGAVVIFQDIGERLEEQRQQEEFLTMASHELRSPLTTILGFAERLERRSGELDEATSDAVSTLLGQARRMQRTIDAVLDVARIEAGVLPLEVEPIELRRLVTAEVAALRERAPEAAIEEVLPESTVTVESDPFRVSQVVTNLLDNAVRYGGEPPRVRVEVMVGSQLATVTVTDNGAGILPEDQPRIFDRSYRTARPSAARGDGLGLGLHISKEIVERLGGELSFRTTAGEGTVFSLTLPVSYEPRRRPVPGFSTLRAR